jgi:tRNA threonylcarbamoyladenosine biosynthesis protein TsaE
MGEHVIVTHSAEETIAQGKELAAKLEPPVLVLLYGELGSGKTTFNKGLISGLGAAREEEVTSPTFNLVHVFEGRSKVFHVDLYRVSGFHELETLGLEDGFVEPAVVIVEWPERFAFRAAWPIIRVFLEHGEGDSRRIRIESAVLAPQGSAAAEGG